MDFSAAFSIKPCKFGKGLFAEKDFKEGEIICTVSGKLLTFNDTLLLGENESHSLQIDKDKYFLCEPPFLFTNHSCNPNCGLNSHLQLFALQNIFKGEEFFWDYSTSMLERHWTMECLCGAPNCRKIITDFDLLPEDVKNRYLHLNIVLPYIADELYVHNLSIRRA